VIIKYSFFTVLILILCLLRLGTASARMWKASPHTLATDYLIINDPRAGGKDIVLLMWLASPMVDPATTNASGVKSILEKTIVILATHGQIDATGKMSFVDVSLEAKDKTQPDKPLAAVSKDDLPPVSIAGLTAMQAFFRQSLGAMGQGLKMFLFNPGTVSACKKGGLAAAMEGENYTWETPVPGCN